MPTRHLRVPRPQPHPAHGAGNEAARVDGRSRGKEKNRKRKDPIQPSGRNHEKCRKSIGQLITRASHQTARFIRWLQAALYAIEPLSESIAKLKRVWLLKKS